MPRSAKRLVRAFALKGGAKTSRGSRSALSIATRDYHDVAIGVAQPHFPMPRVGIEMRFEYDLCPQLARLLHCFIEIIDLEPDQHSMAHRCRVGMNKVGMIFLVPRMELQHQLARAHYPVISITMGVIRK